MPSWAFTQVPTVPWSAHVTHVPVQAVLQQTPSAQKPLAHSLAIAHDEPIGLPGASIPASIGWSPPMSADAASEGALSPWAKKRETVIGLWCCAAPPNSRITTPLLMGEAAGSRFGEQSGLRASSCGLGHDPARHRLVVDDGLQRGFHRRGGSTDNHADGWGIAFFEGRGCRMFLDAKPAVESPIADLVRGYPIRSMNVIAHIRRATKGVVALENTHPFIRESWGRYWIFTHNGTLNDFSPKLEGFYRPVGNTDSERAFCYILETLRRRFPEEEPPLEACFAVLRDLTTELAQHGRFNYLLSNGEYLIQLAA